MSNEFYICAIDQGTTSSRVILFDENFSIQHQFQKEVELFYPEHGFVEQDALKIWNDVVLLLKQAIKQAAAENKKILTIGITNQRETIVVWDKDTGKPIHNALVWQDRRTDTLCTKLKAEGNEHFIQQKTGLLLDPYFSATKLKWILNSSQENINNLLCGTIDSWLLWNLTGGKTHATDATNASRTLLYNIHTHEWDDELLKFFEITHHILPTVKYNADDFGHLNKEIFGTEIPINGIAGDQQAALIGQNCFEKGLMKATYGTGCFALLNIGDKPILSQNKLLTTPAFHFKNSQAYALEGSIFIAGAAIQFLRDGLELFKQAGETETLAKNLENNDGVYFIPALTGLGAPYWLSDVRGAIFGLSRNTKKAHLVRAALEAQAFQTFDLLKVMENDSTIRPTALNVDGGLIKNKFVCQFVSDILNLPINVPSCIESTAFGAAYCAALGHGIFKNLGDLELKRKIEQIYTPQMNETLRNKNLHGWHFYSGKLLAEV